MELKFWLVFVTALVPLIVGSVYYNPALAGKVWMKESGMTDEKIQSGNMLKIFGSTYILGILMSFIMYGVVIHQMGVFSLFVGSDFETAGTDMHKLYGEVMNALGGAYRSWSHGMLHGVLMGLFFVWPIIAINGLFEHKGWKYVAVHVGYWTITLALIGGIICAYA